MAEKKGKTTTGQQQKQRNKKQKSRKKNKPKTKLPQRNHQNVVKTLQSRNTI